MSSQPPDAEREYRLIEQLELRVASANTDEKFESILHKFLAALLLKLGSPTLRNRNLTIKVCQHIHQRLKIDSSIPLPIQSLLKTFREADATLVKQFALIFIDQGLTRLPSENASEILPELLRLSTPQSATYDVSDGKMRSIAFDYLLKALKLWRVPDHATKEDFELKAEFGLSEHQSSVLAESLSKFLLYDPKSSNTTQDLNEDFSGVFERHFRSRQHLVHHIAKFLFLSIFNDADRLIPATLLSVDANAPASTLADAMFKQCDFDFESDTTIDALFAVYDKGKPKLQTRILALLTKSQLSTQRSTRILQIVEKQLFQESAGLEAAKLRAAVFTYLTWAVRVSNNLGSARERLQTALKEFIELQGWPTMQNPSPAEIDLRAKAYESLGLLSSIKKPNGISQQSPSIDLITWMFTSLRCDVSRDIRGSIDEALSRVLSATAFTEKEDQARLKELLLWNIAAADGDEDPVYFQPTKISTKFIAVRFANKCLPFHDIDARYLDLLALGTEDQKEVTEEATRGMNPYWYASNSGLINTGPGETLAFPAFKDFSNLVYLNQQATTALRQKISSLSASVVFSRNLIVTEALQKTKKDVRGENEWRTSIEGLISNDLESRELIKAYLALVESPSLIALLEAAISGLSMGSHDCSNVALELIGMTPKAIIEKLSSLTLQQCREGQKIAAVQQQSSRILGIIASLSDHGAEIATEALAKCSTWQSSIGQDAIAVRGHLLTAVYIVTRAKLRGTSVCSSSLIAQLWELVTSIILQGRDKALVEAAYTSLGQLSLCIPENVTDSEKILPIFDKLIAESKKEIEPAAHALGRLVNAQMRHTNDDEYAKLVDRMFALHEVRKTEFQFAVGEALAVSALGLHSLSTITDLDVEAQTPRQGDYPDLFSKVLDRCIAECKTTKPSLKKAAAIWLLCLIQYCDNNVVLKPRLQDCQSAFARLLTDRDGIVQETGSRGLGMVFEKGDQNLRDGLVRELVQSFTGGNVKMSGTVNEDTQLFEAGALPTEGGQSVTTYKDIVSLATEMGDPSLVYKFMNLASNNAIWTSRAAFGRFGLSGILADSSYLSENKKFYPKLFRYRFDPNPNVQKSMDDIWKAVVKDSNKVIEENFNLIMDDLLQSVVSGKEWRAREASCAAIADLVQGREVEKFEQYLDNIWNVAFKVLDDVKESVRIAAMKLCRTLTSMLIRNLEVGQGTTKRAKTMLGRALPFLLNQMENGAAKELQQYAVVTLLEVVKKAPPISIQPFASSILETMILSLSSLEHENINYLHLNADKYGLTAEKLDKLRVSSINSSPVTEAIEKCLESLSAKSTEVGGEIDKSSHAGVVDTSSSYSSPVSDAMQRLEKAFKAAIGLPSKVGLSRVMVTLVVRHQAMFRPFADRFVQLTRKYILDRNATISVSFSTALSYLLRLASAKEVEQTNRYAQQLYFQSEELSHREVAGEIMQAVSKVSNDVFMHFASSFLPFAFVGRNDLDEGVRNNFDHAWKDNVGGSRALNLYLTEIMALINTHIGSNLWPIKQACCLAVAELVSTMDPNEAYTTSEAQLVWPVMQEALNGKTWEGKEKVISAYPIFVKKARSIWNENDKQLKAIMLREAKRKNAAYRAHAIEALGEFASQRPDLDLAKEVFEVLTNVADELDDEKDAMEVDGAQTSQTRLEEDTWLAITKCIFQSLSTSGKVIDLDQAMNLVSKARTNKSATIDIEIYDGARRFITHTMASTTDMSSHIGRRRTEAVTDTGKARLPPNDLLEAFLPRFVLATFVPDSTRHTFDTEKTRKSRVDFAVVVADRNLLDHTSRSALLPILQEWSRAEKSRPLKMDLEKAVESLTSSSTLA